MYKISEKSRAFVKDFRRRNSHIQKRKQPANFSIFVTSEILRKFEKLDQKLANLRNLRN